MAFANLHIHSYFSDGLTGPHELAKQIVNEDGLTYFALTDHDNMSGIEPLMRSLKNLNTGVNRDTGLPDDLRWQHFFPIFFVDLRFCERL